MYQKITKIVFFSSALVLALPALGQKNKTLSALTAYKRSVSMLQDGNKEGAKKEWIDAKNWIDESYNHSSDNFTGSKDAKTLFYRGEIYTGIAPFALDADMADYNLEEMVQTGLDSYKAHIALPNKKSKDDRTAEIRNKIGLLRVQSFNLGVKFFQEQNYKMALAGYWGAAELFQVIGETDSAAYFNAGISALYTENWDTAAMAFKKCAEIGYQKEFSIAKAGEVLFKAGKADEASKVLADGAKEFPKYADFFIIEGNHWMLSGDNEKAQAALNKAKLADPENESVRYAVGALYFESGKYDEAQAEYEAALKIRPDYVDALYGMGAIYNNKAAAIDAEIETLSDFKLMEEKGAERDGLLKKALEWFEKAHEANPKDKLTLKSLYQIYSKFGEKEKADKIYDLLKN